VSYLAIVKKAEEELKHDSTPVAQEVRERANSIQAVKITSTVLGDDIWLILDRDFIPHDGLACYYVEEIPLLKNKSVMDLKLIHETKLIFPGARVIQEGAEVIG